MAEARWCHNPAAGLLTWPVRSRCLGILAAEPLHAASRVHQPLFAGKERVANRADFHVDVALVGRTGLKVVSAGAKHTHRGVIGMNLFLGHL